MLSPFGALARSHTVVPDVAKVTAVPTVKLYHVTPFLEYWIVASFGEPVLFKVTATLAACVINARSVILGYGGVPLRSQTKEPSRYIFSTSEGGETSAPSSFNTSAI